MKIKLLGTLLAALGVSNLQADPITYDPTGGSGIYQDAGSATPGNQGDNEAYSGVYSFPYAGSTTATYGTATGTTTAALTTSDLSFDVVGDAPDISGYGGTSVFSYIYFIAGSGTNYAISGSDTLLSITTNGGFSVELFDRTANTQLYYASDDPTGLGTTDLTDFGAGNSTGALTEGDHYFFYISASFVGGERALRPKPGPGSGTGEFSVAFTQTPEPSTWAMMLLGFAILGIYARRKLTKTLLPKSFIRAI